MRRCIIVRAFSGLLCFAAVMLAGLMPAGRVYAGSYNYPSIQRTVNAGILLIDGNTPSTLPAEPIGPANPAPYLFYILNNREDVKPFGWNIVNPYAPGTVTSDIQNRWPSSYRFGNRITPNMAAYWEVTLSTVSTDDLLHYNILYLPIVNQNTPLRADDVEKLRRFVDAGGQLWVETPSVNDSISAAAPLFFDANFISGSSGGTATPATILQHPVIGNPFFLTRSELSQLGYLGLTNNWIVSAGAMGTVGSYGLLSPVLNASASNPLIEAGQIGAGQVIVTSLNTANAINDPIDTTGAGNRLGYCYSVAATSTAAQLAAALLPAYAQSLKFATDVISWTGTHNNEHQNSRQNAASDDNSVSSLEASWEAPVTSAGTVPLPGAAIYANVVYVVSNGVLHAYDAFPAEDLDNDGNPDDGHITDYSLGAPYDEIANQNVGANASAPTVATLPDGNTYVFVETAAGAVTRYNSFDLTSPQPVINAPSGATSYSGAIAAPAPTYYAGRIYAGEPDGSLAISSYIVNSSNMNAQTNYPLNPAGMQSGEYVTAPPSVGLISDIANVANPDPNVPDATDVVAAVSTNYGVYMAYLGARGEKLQATAATPPNYATKLANIDGSLAIEPGSGLSRAYTVSANGYPSLEAGLTPDPVTRNQFIGTVAGTPPVYADYDVKFPPGTQTLSLTRTTASFLPSNSGATVTAITPTPTVSAPAIDRNGNVYYTVNYPKGGGTISVLYSLHDSASAGNDAINWRFRLPLASESVTDADGVTYSSLAGYTFVGAPVVDSDGFVYVAASNGANAAVLCFNGAQQPYIDIVAPGTATPQGAINGVTISQTDEYGHTQSGIINQAGNRANLSNFGGVVIQSAGRGVVSPTISEPFNMLISYNYTDGANSGAVPPTPRPLHTNLSWYTFFTANSVTGLAKAGSYLYLGDGNGNIQKVYAYPQKDGIVPANKFVAPTGLNASQKPVVTQVSGPIGVGAILSPPSAGPGVMVLNGQTGIGAMTGQLTLAADNNRLLELDSDGNVDWAVDSTTQTSYQAQTVSSHVDLNHPTSVTQITSDDFLVADTGNNRCVRFDRSGNVLWELTKFTDNASAFTPQVVNSPLLPPGQPLTLNHPTSVRLWHDTDASNQTIYHYLIADTGNFRVVEVDDIYSAAGQPVALHQLAWVSHTYDRQGRQYQYLSADTYYYNGLNYIVALVGNKKIAPLPTGASGYVPGDLAVSTADSEGGTIVLLDYKPNQIVISGQNNGYISNLLTSIRAYLYPAGTAVTTSTGPGRFDQDTAAVDTSGGSTRASVTTLPLRNPRFLERYFTTISGNLVQGFLLADDDGVFDLAVLPNSGNPLLRAQWGFTQADYQVMKTPVVRSAVSASPQLPFSRTNMAFVPSCLQKTGSIFVNNTYKTVGRYLITVSSGQSEINSDSSKIGGEVFETVPFLDTVANVLTNVEQHDNPNGSLAGPVFEYSGTTWSRPANSGPLTQPRYAARAK